MNTRQKKSLYESIMKNVSKLVKKALNEDEDWYSDEEKETQFEQLKKLLANSCTYTREEIIDTIIKVEQLNEYCSKNTKTNVYAIFILTVGPWKGYEIEIEGFSRYAKKDSFEDLAYYSTYDITISTKPETTIKLSDFIDDFNTYAKLFKDAFNICDLKVLKKLEYFFKYLTEDFYLNSELPLWKIKELSYMLNMMQTDIYDDITYYVRNFNQFNKKHIKVSENDVRLMLESKGFKEFYTKIHNSINWEILEHQRQWADWD